MITAGFEQTRGFVGKPHELAIGTVPVPTGGTVFVGTGTGTTKYTRGLPMSCLIAQYVCSSMHRLSEKQVGNITTFWTIASATCF
jgi:hypothetical protein